MAGAEEPCRGPIAEAKTALQEWLLQLRDGKSAQVPLGFSHRLHRRLEENMPGDRRSFLGWMVAAAAAVLVAGSFDVARSSVFRCPELRSEHA
jgi:hypothetical protein